MTQYHFNIKQKRIRQLFILYSCALFYVVFLTPNRYKGGTSRNINFIPVIETYKRLYKQGGEHFWPYYINYWGNIFGNIILFIPFGLLLRYLNQEKAITKVLLYSISVSICIEILQLAIQVGVCDVDDVILNSIGATSGLLLYKQLIKLR